MMKLKNILSGINDHKYMIMVICLLISDIALQIMNSDKLEEIKDNVGSIESDISSIESKIDSIESDVGSILYR